MTVTLPAARRFLLCEARLLERLVAGTLFDGEDAGGPLAALAAYRNDDGGFGHGLEPDVRAQASQPLDVEIAFGVMDTIGRVDGELVIGACDFLRSIGPGVGCLRESALVEPKAPHWEEWADNPSLNPTAGLAAYLWKWDLDHPWRDEATAFCLGELGSGLPGDAHTLGEVLALLDALPDVGRAEALLPDVERALPDLALFNLEPATDYGLTPLHFATSPASRWRRLFADDVIDRHLDALANAQDDDGGWPISWETVGPAARQEWRGIETVRALRTLRAYGRLG